MTNLKLHNFLFKETDATVLSLFRIVFGAFMIYQMLYYFQLDYTLQFMSGPEFLFHYPFLEFLVPFAPVLLKTIHFGLLIAAVLITVGLFYRYACAFFFIGFSYFSFIDKTLYNNHLYLIALIALVMIFMDADKKFSLKKTKVGANNGVAKWQVHLLQFLFFIVYFFGGLSKINADWIGGNLPTIMYHQSAGSALHSLLPKEFLISMINYGGLLYDLLIGFLLLYRPTRWYAFIGVLIFNLTNGLILFGDIGLFPFFMICSTIIFFDSDQIKGLYYRLFPKKVDKKKRKKSIQKETSVHKKTTNGLWMKPQKITVFCLIIFVGFQLIFPLRYIALTDNPEWTGIGSRFAWRMKMQSRKLDNMKMTIKDRTTGAVTDIDHTSFVSSNQYTHMIEDPYAVVQFAKYIHRKAIERGMADPIINTTINVSFNGHPAQLMLDPEADLSRVDESAFAKRDWIMPLKR